MILTIKMCYVGNSQPLTHGPVGYTCQSWMDNMLTGQVEYKIRPELAIQTSGCPLKDTNRGPNRYTDLTIQTSGCALKDTNQGPNRYTD